MEKKKTMYLSTPPFLCLSHHLLGFIVIFLIQYVKKSCLKIMCSIALDSLIIRLRNFLKLFSAGFVLGTAMGIISFFAAPKEKERQHSCLVPDLSWETNHIYQQGCYQTQLISSLERNH